MTSVAQYIGFYTGSADHVPEKNVNKYVGSSSLHKRDCLNIVFLSHSKQTACVIKDNTYPFMEEITIPNPNKKTLMQSPRWL